jgi:hypothetical protein
MRTLAGLFDTRGDAIDAIDDLVARGVPRADISLLSGDTAGWSDESVEEEAGVEAGAGIGALAGGLLAGLGLLAVPGIGELVAAGWLLSTAAGVAAGAIIGGATGGLIAWLTESGVAEGDAHVFAEGLRRGGTLLTVEVDETKAVAAEAILIKHGVDIAARRNDLESGGWTRFDDDVPSDAVIAGKRPGRVEPT